MSYVTLDEAKAHLLVIHDSDDDLIQACIDAAESYSAGFMNRPAIEDNPVNPWKKNTGTIAEWKLPVHCQPVPPVVSSEPDDMVPASVIQAIKLILADFYENRTAGIVGTIYTANPAADNLLWQQRIGMGI